MSIFLLIILNPLLSYVAFKMIPGMAQDNLHRKVLLGDFKVNLFTGYLSFDNLTIYEVDGKTNFFNLKKFILDVEYLKLFKKQIYVKYIELNTPSSSIQKKNSKFNFSDIIETFTKKTGDDKKVVINKKESKNSNWAIVVKKFSVLTPEISFNDDDTDLKLNYNLDSFSVTDLVIDKDISLLSDVLSKEYLKVAIKVNQTGKKFHTTVNINRFSLKFLEPVLRHFLNISEIDGEVTSRIDLSLSEDFKDIELQGFFQLNKLNLKDLKSKKIVSFDDFKVDINKSNLLKNSLNIKSINLSGLNTHFDLYKSGNNFEKIVKKSNLKKKVKPKSVVTKSKGTVKLYYAVDKVSLSNANIKFNDRSKKIPFSLNLSNLKLNLSNIKSENSMVDYLFFANLNKSSSSIKVTGSVQQPKNIKGTSKIELKNIKFSYFANMVKRFVNLNQFSGNLSMLSNVQFEFVKSKPKIVLSTNLNIQNLSLVDKNAINLIAINGIDLKVDKFDSVANSVKIGHIRIDEPKLNFYQRPKGNAVDFMLGKKSDKDDVQKTSNRKKDLSPKKVPASKSGFKLDLGEFYIKNGQLRYIDYIIKGAPKVRIDKLNFDITNFNNYHKKRAKFKFKTVVNGRGQIYSSGSLAIAPKRVISARTKIKNLSLNKLKKIINNYSPIKIKNGKVNYNGKFSLWGDKIKSENEVILNDLKVGDDKNNIFDIKIPLSMVLTILEDSDNNINLDIPLEGNLKKPDFKITTIVVGALKNILVGVITSPLKILKAIAGENEQIEFVEIPYFSDNSEKVSRKIKLLSKLLKSKKHLQLSFSEKYNAQMLRSEVGLLFAKELHKDSLLKANAVSIETAKTDIMNKEFLNFISLKITKKDESKSIDEKIKLVVGKKKIDNYIKELLKAKRETVIKEFSANDIDSSRVVFEKNSDTKSSSNNIVYDTGLHFRMD